MPNSQSKWINWNLWIREGELREEGVVTDCFTKDNVITFCVGERQFSFYLRREDKPQTPTRFWGDGSREAILLPPSSV